MSNSIENEVVNFEINYRLEGDNLNFNGLNIGNEIIIYDYLGNILMRKTTQNESEIMDISQLKTGIYFVKIGEEFSKFWKVE
ncbi:MAG: T9SS type A sorting domain-containing protein [Candidatus Kapaibacteriota bacterium]